MFMVAMGLALVGYALFPTAPPRLLPERGLHRHDRHLHRGRPGLGDRSASWSTSTRPCRACTSRFSLMIAVPAMALSAIRSRAALWSAYPLLVFFVDRRHRQPLLARRRRRRRGRLRWRRSPPRQLARGCARRLVVVDPAGEHGSSASPRGPRTERRWTRTAEVRRAELRATPATALIESRLTPNAISITGLVLNLAAAVLITRAPVLPRRASPSSSAR